MELSKHFLTGLHPSPPPDYIWQQWNGYSIYLAQQHRSTWHRHTHECTQLTMALAPAHVTAEWQDSSGGQGRQELSGDSIWLVPPGLTHASQFNRQAPLIHFYFEDDFFDRITENVVTEAASTLRPSLLVGDPFLINMAKELFNELQFGALNELYTQSAATLAANHLIRRYSDRPNAAPLFRGGLGPARERRIREYIQQRLESSLSLEELAQVAEISPNYFVTQFGQTVGMTPHKFVLQERVNRACRLLECSKLSLMEIALRCGFQDQSQFTKTFRRYVGTTPGKYKR